MSELEIVFYTTEAGRSQPTDFLDGLAARDRAGIEADLVALSLYGDKAPLSRKPITGHRPMWELRTGGFRALFVRKQQAVWVLHICKKQDQTRGIAVAAARMKHVLGG